MPHINRVKEEPLLFFPLKNGDDEEEYPLAPYEIDTVVKSFFENPSYINLRAEVTALDSNIQTLLPNFSLSRYSPDSLSIKFLPLGHDTTHFFYGQLGYYSTVKIRFFSRLIAKGEFFFEIGTSSVDMRKFASLNGRVLVSSQDHLGAFSHFNIKDIIYKINFNS